MYTPVSVAKTSSPDSVVLPRHVPRTNLVCSAPPDFTSNPANRNRTASANFITFPWYGFPKQCLRVANHVKTCKQPSSVSHQPCPHVLGTCHFHRETWFFLWMTAHVQSNYTKECANSTKKFNTETSTNCQKNGFNKTRTRKRSQDRPLPWFKKQYQVVNAEFRFMRHPRADADPQKFDKSSKVTTGRGNTMRTIATRAHAEEHVERKCEANNCAL